MEAVTDRELIWAGKLAKSRLQYEHLHRAIYNYKKVAPDGQVANLLDYSLIAEHLPLQVKNPLNQFIIRHANLQPHNIFVSELFEVTFLIDWQHCSILLLFLQAKIPKEF